MKGRNQVYSIGQQLMREDPLYYTLYVCLRPDKQWRLISYPYYAKNARPGDNTGFRHIDVNLPRLVKLKQGFNNPIGANPKSETNNPTGLNLKLETNNPTGGI